MPKPAEGGRRHVVPRHGGAALGHASRKIGCVEALERIVVQGLRVLRSPAHGLDLGGGEAVALFILGMAGVGGYMFISHVVTLNEFVERLP